MLKIRFTVGLLNSVPKLGSGSKGRLESIEGTVPLPMDMPPQCGFRSRCERAIAGQCDGRVPPLIEVEEDHLVRCVLYEKDRVVV